MAGGENSGEKEFDPSEQKLRRLREQGNVPKSQEMIQIVTLIAGVVFILATLGFMWEQIREMFESLWSILPQKTFERMGPGYIVFHSAKPFVLIIMPLLLVVSFAAIIGNVGQTGFMFTTSRFFKFDGLNPVNNLKNLFSLDKIFDLIKEILKVFILGFVAWKMIDKHWLESLGLIEAPTVQALAWKLQEIIKDFVIQIVTIMFIIAFMDFAYQRFRFTQKNKMSMKEMKDEYKQTEGDPFVKAQRRALARRLSQRQQIANVPEADFITTNPSKIAVAIKYKTGEMSAPKVLAKGADAFAWRIIQVGKENNIPIIENIPLARALFKLAKVGQEVPPELYRAVAEVLLFVYQIRGKTKTSLSSA